MNAPEQSILTGWWRFAVRAASALTAPADVDGCDRGVEDLARDSWIGRSVHGVSAAMQSAWSTSAGRRAGMALLGLLVSGPEASRWRVAGWILTVTGATALALNPLATNPPGPLTWIVPAALAASGLLMMAAAAPLARAAADRKRRG